MSTNKDSHSDGYWSPINPKLRLPAGVLGALILGTSIWMSIEKGQWRLDSSLPGLTFLALSCIRPEWRNDGMKRTTVMITLGILLAVVAVIFFFLTR